MASNLFDFLGSCPFSTNCKGRLRSTPLLTIYDGILENTLANGIHLAVFVEPYLSFVLEGKKTVGVEVQRQSPRALRTGEKG